MIRLAATAVINLLANAVAFLVGALVLSKMELGFGGFVVAVVIFTVVSTITEPLVRTVARRNAPAILGSTALVATLISLIVTTVVSDGLRISGVLTWILATIIVWLISLAARFLLPFVLFEQILREAPESRSET